MTLLGWVIIFFGSFGLVVSPSTGRISHRWVPISVSVTKSEAKPAFDAVFQGILSVCEKHNISITVLGGMISDHCPASQNSFYETFVPGVIELNERLISRLTSSENRHNNNNNSNRNSKDSDRNSYGNDNYSNNNNNNSDRNSNGYYDYSNNNSTEYFNTENSDNNRSDSPGYRSQYRNIDFLSDGRSANCETHVRRKVKEKKSMTGKVYMDETIIPMYDEMVQAKSPYMFTFLSNTACRIWRNDGKGEFVDWFKKVYLNDKWKYFYISAVPPGVIADQNALESINGAVKKGSKNKSPARMSDFCTTGLDRIFKYRSMSY